MVVAETIRIAVALALAMLLSLATTTGQQSRTVHGKVTDTDGTALKGTVVQIKDMQNLWVRSYISQDDGSYRFVGLSPDVDYEVRASYRGAVELDGVCE